MLFGTAGAAILLAGGALFLTGTPAATAAAVTVYKTPWCGCCSAWIDHLRDAGFQVAVEERDDLAPLKARLGVPPALASCHTAVVDGYAVEGHVPAAEIRRLLAERPPATGLAVPGMPVGSPGMAQGNRRDPYAVILFGPNGQSAVWARYRPSAGA